MDWLFFGPARLIETMPWAGLCIAAALVVADFIRRPPQTGEGSAMASKLARRPAVLAALLWVIFNLYERQVGAVFASDKGLVRLDLLVLTPVLYVMTVFAIVSVLRPQR